MDVKQLGQVFTPPDIVRRMLSLRKNRGAVLEPSRWQRRVFAAFGVRGGGLGN